MKLVLDSKSAKQQYPEFHKQFLAYLRKSKTKSKDTPENEFEYSYNWCIVLKGDHSLQGVIRSLSTPKPKKEKTLQDKIDHFAECAKGISLVIKAGRVERNYEIKGIPNELIENIKKQHLEEEERAKEEALKSPEQKQKELEEILKTLRRGRGFMEIRL